MSIRDTPSEVLRLWNISYTCEYARQLMTCYQRNFVRNCRYDFFLCVADKSGFRRDHLGRRVWKYPHFGCWIFHVVYYYSISTKRDRGGDIIKFYVALTSINIVVPLHMCGTKVTLWWRKRVWNLLPTKLVLWCVEYVCGKSIHNFVATYLLVCRKSTRCILYTGFLEFIDCWIGFQPVISWNRNGTDVCLVQYQIYYLCYFYSFLYCKQ